MLAEKLYNVLTHKKHRAGKKDLSRKPIIIKNIQSRIEKDEPIHFLQFWGGAKNPNLPIVSADLCERKSLDHLFEIHNDVREYYNPGLSITISTGDGRIEFANGITPDNIRRYHDSFLEMLSHPRYQGLFTLRPVSTLYADNVSFWDVLQITYNEINASLDSLPCINRLLHDANNNIDSLNAPELNAREAVLRYVSVMITEERVKLYQAFEDYIRTFFIKFSSDYNAIYKRFLPDLENPFLASKCSLSFYTGSKGNITQPWQAIGVEEDGKILFLSQKRLKEYKY